MVQNYLGRMTKEEIIGNLFTSTDFKLLLDNVVGHSKYRDDLVQEVMVILLEKDNDLIQRIYAEGRILHYTYGIIRNQFRGEVKKSFFYKKFVYNNEIFIDNENEDYIFSMEDNDYDIKDKILRENIQKDIDELLIKENPYKSVIFKMYYKLDDFNNLFGEFRDEKDYKKIKSSYRKLEKNLNITRSELNKIVLDIKEKIHNKIYDKYKHNFRKNTKDTKDKDE